MRMIYKTAMDYFRLFIASVLLMSSIGCSTISSNRQAVNLSALTAGKTYQVRVRSGNLALDKIIYDYVSLKFGEYLQMAGKKQFDNYIEIVFQSTLKEGISKSSAGYITNMIYGNSWYTGDDSPWSGDYPSSSGTEIIPGGMSSRQNSTTTVVLRDSEGSILWRARCLYKGGSELSGLYVKAADEAARISLDKIIMQFEKDFIFIPKAAEHEDQNKMPGIALVIEDGTTVIVEDPAIDDTAPAQ